MQRVMGGPEGSLWHPGYFTGRFYTPNPAPSTDLLITASQLYYAPITIYKTCTIDQLIVRTSVAGSAGARARLGLYADNGSGQPVSLLSACTVEINVDSGAPAALTGTLTTPQIVRPGLVWAAMATDAAATQGTFRASLAMGGAGYIIGASTAANALTGAGCTGYSHAYAYAALPATASALSSSGVTPFFAFRVA